jgi:hypothetical protein
MALTRPIKSANSARPRSGSAYEAEQEIDRALAEIYKQYGSNLAQFFKDLTARRERERQMAEESDRASSAQQKLDLQA